MSSRPISATAANLQDINRLLGYTALAKSTEHCFVQVYKMTNINQIHYVND